MPAVRGDQVVKALEKVGFLLVRVRGSHQILRHDDGRGTTVPVHQGRDLAVPGRMPASHGWPVSWAPLPVIRRLLAEAGISRPPRPVMTARRRRRATDQRLARRAAQLGYATLEHYLADRVVRRGWPLQRIADQLGVDVRTLRDRPRRLDLHRLQASIR